MSFGRLFWLAAGTLTGGYLAHRWRRNLAIEPKPLFDHSGRRLEPRIIELAGGECVEVAEAGEGPAIVFVPGLTGDREVFRYQITSLSSSYRVIAPNLRESFEGVDREFDQFAHDIATIMSELGVEAATLLGLSFGGPICIRFATLYPDRVTALVLNNTLMRLDLSHVGLNRTLLIPIARWTSRFLPVSLMRRVSDFWGRLQIWVYDPSPGNERVIDYELGAPARVPMAVGGERMDTFKDRDLRPELPDIHQPALVISGSRDRYTLPAWQREIAGLLPNATYVEVPNGGHLTLISRAETFNEVVEAWLAGVHKQ